MTQFRRMLHAAALGAVTFMAAPAAFAAPFCIEMTGVQLQCQYVDPLDCQKDAQRQGGRCAANPAEFRTPPGTTGYCLIESGNVATCVYPDRQSCMAEGARKNAPCISAVPQPTENQGVDPYAVQRPF
jgi:hypothetical protein